MKFKAPEAILQFFDGVGNEHKPNADGLFETDHVTTINEMLAAGFEKVKEEVKELVEDVEQKFLQLVHHETGAPIARAALQEVKTGDTLEDGVGGKLQVVVVSEDGKTASVLPIVQNKTVAEVQADEEKAKAAEDAKKLAEDAAAAVVKADAEAAAKAKVAESLVVVFVDDVSGLEVHRVTMPESATAEKIAQLARDAISEHSPIILGAVRHNVLSSNEAGTEVRVSPYVEPVVEAANDAASEQK